MAQQNNPEGGWSLKVNFKMAFPDPFIIHRGMVYPRVLSAMWRREDGLQLDIDIEVEAEAGARVRRFTVTGADMIDSADFRQPVQSMAKRAVAAMAAEPDGLGNATFPPSQPASVVVGRVTSRTNDARLTRVADLYGQALSDGEPVTSLIEKEEHVSQSTAYGLISRARKAGFLPPSRPGRKATSE